MAAADFISRAEAKRLGLKRYFTGEPCKHGHVAERATVNGLCCECGRIKSRARYHADPQADLERQRQYRLAHPEVKGLARERLLRADPELSTRVAARQADLLSRAAAREAGRSMYDSPRACGKCGSALRFAGDGKCVECNRLACRARLATPEREERKAERAARALELAKRSAAAKAIREARQGAIARGELTYQGRPCPNGHDGIRYAKHGSCVQCAAQHATSPEKRRYDAAYAKANRGRILMRTRAYYEANRERSLRKAAEWIARNPERAKAIKQNYKHRRRAQEDAGISSAELAAWKRAQKKVCYWCGSACSKGFVVDHYQPLARGGKHELENLVIACRPCNARKSARDPLEFAKLAGRLF